MFFTIFKLISARLYLDKKSQGKIIKKNYASNCAKTEH